jgi:hypothetical protein
MRSQTHLAVTLVAFGILGRPFRASGQSLSVGVIGGAGLTSDFRSNYVSTFPGGEASIDYSTPKRYLVGAMIELGLPAHFSLEADGLYRPLGFTFAGVEPNGTLNSVSPATVITWEFPVLAKYRFTLGPLRPFVEAGPSFRTAGNLNGTNPSHNGVTSGIGIETHVWGMNVAPTLRYTRWAADHETTPDQIELMVAINRQSESIRRPLGRRFSLGVSLGTNVTSYFPAQNYGYDIGPGSSSISTTSVPGPQSLLVGPMIEMELAKGFSVEGDALYQPLHYTLKTTVDGRREPDYVGSNIEWNFPVLAKYRRAMHLATPFVELGPSFRLPQGVFGASHYGVTAGLGAEMHLGRLRIAPGFRYTHWGPNNSLGAGAEFQNRLEFLTGFSF